MDAETKAKPAPREVEGTDALIAKMARSSAKVREEESKSRRERLVMRSCYPALWLVLL